MLVARFLLLSAFLAAVSLGGCTGSELGAPGCIIHGDGWVGTTATSESATVRFTELVVEEEGAVAKFVIEMPASERPIQLEIDDREAGGASHEERFEPSNAQSLERELRLPTWHPNGSIHQVWVRIIEVTADIFTEGGAFERYEGESLDGGCFVFQPPPNPPPATTRVEY